MMNLQKKQTVSKRLRVRDAGVDFARSYPLAEAVALLKERSKVKFDEMLDVVFMCALDTKKGDQALRGMISLPQGTGKKVRIAVFAEGDQAQKARDLGADVVGGGDLVDEVAAGRLDFDLCLATPAMMVGIAAKLGRVLGPKGLMPNPKLGTVAADISGPLQAAKKGQVSLRAEKAGIVHAPAGKLSFSVDQLIENVRALCDGLVALKPTGVKGHLVRKMFVSSTMGFSLMVDMAADGLST